jgi:hypothetical protein
VTKTRVHLSENVVTQPIRLPQLSLHTKLYILCVDISHSSTLLHISPAATAITLLLVVLLLPVTTINTSSSPGVQHSMEDSESDVELNEEADGEWEEWDDDDEESDATRSLFSDAVLPSPEAAFEHDARHHNFDIRQFKIEVSEGVVYHQQQHCALQHSQE